MTTINAHTMIQTLAARAANAQAEDRVEEACRCYQAILAMEPAYMPLFFPFVMARLTKGDRAGAVLLSRRAVAAGARFPVMLLLAAVAELTAGNGDRAGVLFELAMNSYGQPWDRDVFIKTLPDWLRFIEAMKDGYAGAADHMGRAAPAAYGTGAVDAACPVCGTRPTVHLFSVTALQAAAHFTRSNFNPPAFRSLAGHITALWGGPECVIARCGTCGFGFAHPYVAGDAQFYATTFDGALYPDDKWEFEVTREVLRARRAAGAPLETLLEIGAGKGAFITSLTPDLARAENVAFTEYNAAWRDALVDRGFTPLSPDIARCPPPSCLGRFDAVCAFQVVEHCDRLDELFAGFAALTRPGGSLFLAVPGASFIEFAERFGGMIDMPPNHIGRWTPAALDIVARRHGWVVADCRLDPTETPRERLRALQSSRFMRESHIPGAVAQIISLCPEEGVRNGLMMMIAQFYEYLLNAGQDVVANRAFSTTLWAHLVRSGAR